MHKNKVLKMNTDNETPETNPRKATTSPTPTTFAAIALKPLPTEIHPIDLTGITYYSTIEVTRDEVIHNVDVFMVNSLGDVALTLDFLGTTLREIDRTYVERRDVGARKKRKWFRVGEMKNLLDGSRTMTRTRRAAKRTDG